MAGRGGKRPGAGRKPGTINGIARSLPSLGRHQRKCSICAHEKREEIESDFISWKSPASIAAEYGLATRASVYCHAHALGLLAKRQRNVRAALEKLIEQAGEVEANASAVVAAIQAYSKINADGQWVDRSEHVSLNDLFDRMTAQELEEYVQRGTLPQWFETYPGSGPALIVTKEGSPND